MSIVPSPDELTAQEVDDLKEAFSLFEREDDGTISTKEVETIVTALGFTPTETDLQEMIKEVDASGSGRVAFAGFRVVMAGLMKDTGDDQGVREAFRLFDKEGNGIISVVDLRHVLTSMGEKLTTHELEQMIKEADVFNNGRINYEDFITRLSMYIKYNK